MRGADIGEPQACSGPPSPLRDDWERGVARLTLFWLTVSDTCGWIVPNLATFLRSYARITADGGVE